MGEMIKIACPDGHAADGYKAVAQTPKGAVVVIQEWWGLNDQIKGVADRFAAAGYTAIAPDLYAGRVTQDADEANHIMSGLDWAGATAQEVRGAVQMLKSEGHAVAVMGFCMGGALTIIAGVKVPECDAAVCFYGIPPKEAADPAEMKVPFQAHFATRDDWCTPDAVAQLRAEMEGLSVPVEIHEYEGEHAFFNETSPAYNRSAAEISWDRMLAFLGEHLSVR